MIMKKMIIKVHKIKLLSLLLVIFLVTCAEQKWNDYYSTPDFVAEGNIFDVLSKNPDYKTFTELLVKSGCDSVLKSGSSHTVLAVKNNALASVDPNMPREKLKELMGMHITSSVLYSSNMIQTNMQAVSGKMLYFSGTSSADIKVNKDVAVIVDSEVRTLSGAIYNVDKVIEAFPSLYDIIATHPDLTILYNFIQDNLVATPDPLNNKILSYDSLNRPIYEEPINYIDYSEFLEVIQADNELIQTTAFLPSNDVILKAMEGILDAKGGDPNMIIPRLGPVHSDTIVAYRFFKSNIPYKGDTTVFLNRFFTRSFILGNVENVSGTQTFTNLDKGQLSISSGDIKSSIRGSNGYIHIMKEMEAPTVFFRNEFWCLVVEPTGLNASGVMQWAVTPNYFSGPGMGNGGRINRETQQWCIQTGYFGKIWFDAVGNWINFVFPFVIPGTYDVIVGFYPDNEYGAFLDISYGYDETEQGKQVLKQNVNYGGRFADIKFTQEANIGSIDIDRDKLVITFTCRASSQYQNGGMELFLEYLKLIPVDK